jgi:hypothetical protein
VNKERGHTTRSTFILRMREEGLSGYMVILTVAEEKMMVRVGENDMGACLVFKYYGVPTSRTGG